MIVVRCFDSLAAADFLRSEINALNRVCSRPDPFSTFEYFENFLRCDQGSPGSRQTRLWFLTAFRGDSLVGYLVLKEVVQKVLGIGTRTLTFLVTNDTDRLHAVARSEDLREVGAAFCAHLRARKREWSFLELQQEDDIAALFARPADIAFDGCLVRQWPSPENCTIHLHWDTLRDYCQALTKKFRSNLRRQMRLLLAAGKVELLASDDPATTPALFELYRSIEPHSWKSFAKLDIGRHPQQIEYFKGLLDARQPMRVTIHILLMDGIPIAGLISGAFMTGLYALHIVYDARVSHLAPGSVMLLMGVRQAIDGKYAFFNLLSGFGYYKVRWLAEVTETRIAQVYRGGGLPYWRRVAGDWKRRLFADKTTQLPMRFNPTRRDVSHLDGERSGGRLDPGEFAKPQIDPREQERIAKLVAEVRKSVPVHLSSEDLAALMPGATRQVAPAPARSDRVGTVIAAIRPGPCQPEDRLH